MEFANYVRLPFLLEAVEVTVDNIEELAPLAGELRHKEDGTPFIHVNKKLVQNVFRVYTGFFITRMGDNVRCYSPKVFQREFTAMNSDWAAYFGMGETPDNKNTEVESAQVLTVD